MKWNDPRILNAFIDPKRSKKKAVEPDWVQSAKTLAGLAAELPQITRVEIRYAFVQWLRDIRPNIFLTLAIRPHTSYITFGRQADKLINQMLQRAHGRGWSDQPKSIRPKAIGFLEHPYSNPHFHVMLRGDREFHEALVEHGPKLWRKLMNGGAFNVQTIRSEDDVIGYCLKEQVTLDRFMSAYVYSAGTG